MRWVVGERKVTHVTPAHYAKYTHVVPKRDESFVQVAREPLTVNCPVRLMDVGGSYYRPLSSGLFLCTKHKRVVLLTHTLPSCRLQVLQELNPRNLQTFLSRPMCEGGRCRRFTVSLDDYVASEPLTKMWR